jgi:hypothetical protein
MSEDCLGLRAVLLEGREILIESHRFGKSGVSEEMGEFDLKKVAEPRNSVKAGEVYRACPSSAGDYLE